jgi:UDP:flavonoid glycosyltransferase YjiC (YdhE family)
MKVAIVAVGTRGDVHPMLSLGAALTAAGHGVRLFAPPDFADDAAATGLEFVPVGASVRAYLGGLAGALHGNGLAFVREMTRYCETTVGHEFATLPGGTADVDFVIGAGTTMFAASAAELHGIPFRYVAYVPSLLPSPTHTPAMFPFQVRARWANRLLWRGATAAMNAMTGRTVNAYRERLGLAPVSDIARHVLSPRPLVAVDAPLAPMPADCPVAHDQIRCLHPFDREPLPDDLERFLDAGAPPVYLGFGSMTDPNPTRTTGQVLEAITRLGCRAIISRAWAGLGDGDLPEGAMAVDPVSHASLFPRCSAVVHHGGAGTTHTASRAGVPQVVVPHVLDQFYFARRVQALGVAPPPIPRAKFNVARLAATVRDTLERQNLSARAADLARQLADLGPVSPPASAVLDDGRG